MKVYRDAFVRDDIYSAAATSVVIAVATLVLSFGFLRLVQPRAFAQEMTMSATTRATAPRRRTRRPRRPARRRPPAAPVGSLPTAVLLLGALYCLLPVAWVVVAATKSQRRAVHHVHLRARHRPARTTSSTSARTATACTGAGWPTPRCTPASARCCRPCVSALPATPWRSTASPAATSIFNVLLAGVLVPGGHPGHPAVPAAGQGRPDRHVLVGAAAEHPQPVRHLPGPHLRRRRRPRRRSRGGPHRRRQRVAHLPPRSRCR